MGLLRDCENFAYGSIAALVQSFTKKKNWANQCFFGIVRVISFYD